MDVKHNALYPTNPAQNFGYVQGYSTKELLIEASEKGFTQDEFEDWINSNPLWFQVENAPTNFSYLFKSSLFRK